MTRELKRWLVHGPIRPVTQLCYRAAISMELGCNRVFGGRSRPVAEITKDLTAVIKTFERPEILKRLIDSIRRHYPELHLIVVDDSRQPSRLPGVDSLSLPFDSGVSAGRAAGLAAVQTRFVLMLDDDFIFTRGTRLEIALEALQAHPVIDLVAGRVVDLPLFRSPARSGRIWPTPAKPLRPLGSTIGGLLVVDKAPNFYVARTERLRDVGWDLKIRRLDHAEFFTRAMGRIVCVQDDRWSVWHAKTPFDRHYMRFREDVEADRRYIAAKWPQQ